MAWLRRLPILRRLAGAVPHADLGPYAGAPREPDLRVDGADGYSLVRYATSHIAYTCTSTSQELCPRCGQPVRETHNLRYMGGTQTSRSIGVVHACRDCHPDTWLRRSQMPGAIRQRQANHRNVL